MKTTEAYNSMKKILLALPEAERHVLVGRLSAAMKSNSKSIELLEKCKQSQVTDDRMVCPKCGSVAVVKNGRKGGRQRSYFRTKRSEVRSPCFAVAASGGEQNGLN